jgi:hypothetical protein
MASRLSLLLDLLHGTGDAALATHSVTMEGFPFASAVAFVTDPRHQPVLLISRLAEHTQNVLRDERASLLLRQADGGAEAVRATLVGSLRPLETEPLLAARYQRYHPEAAPFFELGDFALFRLETKRIRVIGGFAQAGWLDGERLATAPSLPLADEAAWIERWQGELPEGLTLLGIDPFGVDLRRNGVRERLLFKPGPVIGEAVGAALARALSPAPARKPRATKNPE